MDAETPQQPQLLGENLIKADIRLLSGKVVSVIFPMSMTDDDLCVLIMELTKNLRVSARTRQQVSPILVPGGARV